MDLVVKLVSSPWFWADIILSISGGLIVAWGLAVENKAEKKIPPPDFRPDIFADIAEAQKREVERSWKILMTGIVFEVVAAFGISVISGLEIADLKDKSAAATLEAKQAAKQAGEANERAAKFDADRVMVEKEAEEIRGTNFVLQAKLLELEGKQKPRTITSEQQTNLIACLSRAPQKGKINIFASVIDAEALDFALQICDVLTKAGFDAHCPTGFAPDAMISIGPPGTSIVVKDVKMPSPQGAYLQRCFMSVGIEIPAINSGDANFSSNSVEIDVGQHF